jgi:hypothetical protein
MAPPTCDRSYCEITSTNLIDIKLNDTLIPTIVNLNR